MMYQALYRKWRPKVFEDLVGQAHIVETIKNQIMSNKIAHAYLFCGSRGTGKTSTAKILSRAVNCLNPVNGNPCNNCECCKGILDGSILDVVEIDGASNNKVDDVRTIRDEVLYAPTNSKYKVYIIDEVHMLTTEAFNALLKTLEEPPSYVIFILATTEFHKIPATIISRCQKFDFKRIAYKDTAERLMEIAKDDNIEVTKSAINLIAKAAEGSLRDAISKLDQCLALGIEKIDYKDVALIIGASDPQFLEDICDAIINEDIKEAFNLIDKGSNVGLDMLRLYTDVIDYFRDLMIIKTSNDVSLVLNVAEEVLEKYYEQAEKITLNRILFIIETMFSGINTAKYTASPKVSFEATILKVASKKTNSDISALLDRLELLEKKVANMDFVDSKPPVFEKPIMAEPICEEVIEEFEIEKNIEQPVIEIEDDTLYSTEEIDQLPMKEDWGIESLTPPFEDVIKEPHIIEEVEQPIEEVEEQPVEEEIEHGEISFIQPLEEPQNIIDDFDNQLDEETLKIAQDIKENYIELLNQANNTDFGFSDIMKKAEMLIETNGINLVFKTKPLMEMAKMNKYDICIKEAILKVYNKTMPINLTVKSDISEKKEETKGDPFDELIDIGKENQIIFNIE